MKKVFNKAGRWLSYALLVLLGIALAVYGYAHWNVEQRLNKVYPTGMSGILVPDDSASIAKGEHLYVVHACRDCHGLDLRGRLAPDHPLMRRLAARNLTRGKGGLPRFQRPRLTAHPQARGKPGKQAPARHAGPLNHQNLRQGTGLHHCLLQKPPARRPSNA